MEIHVGFNNFAGITLTFSCPSFSCKYLFCCTFDHVFRFQSYKRVGGQKHSADMGRGVIGVADITNLIVSFKHHGFPIPFFLFSVREIQLSFRLVHGINFSILLQDDGDGNSWVLNSKQGFQDCEMYAKLEEWLGRKLDEYWDTHFDNLELVWIMILFTTMCVAAQSHQAMKC